MKYQIINKPNPNEYAHYFQNYIDVAPVENIVKSLEDQLCESVSYYDSLNESEFDFRYAPGKWSIKEVIVHILDTERIFNYRALRFARKDNTPLPGFEQDDYIKNTDWINYSIKSIIEEYELVRKHTIVLFNNMTEEMLNQTGISNDMNLSVRAIPFIITGHERHHLNVIKSKYL